MDLTRQVLAKPHQYPLIYGSSSSVPMVLFSDKVDHIDFYQASNYEETSQINKKKSSSSSLFKTNKIKKKNRLYKQESIHLEDVSLRDDIENKDYQEASKTSSYKGKGSISLLTEKTNKKELKRRLQRKVPPQIKDKPHKSKSGPSNRKYFNQPLEIKDARRYKYPITPKKLDDIKEQALLVAQQSSIVEDIESKYEERILPKKSHKRTPSDILPKHNLKVKKDAPLISFGTRIEPKSPPNVASRKKSLSMTGNTRAKKKCDVEEVDLATSQQIPVEKHLDIKNKSVKESMSSAASQQKSKNLYSRINTIYDVKPLKYNVDPTKKLNEMQKRFKKEIMHSFQTRFFHSKKQSDVENKSETSPTRPSSSVSYGTYAKTARKVSELKLINLLKKETLKNKKLRKKKSASKRTKSSDTLSSSIGSELEGSTDDEESKFSRRTDTVLWSEYKPEDFDNLMRIDKNIFKSSLASSLSEVDKNDRISLTSSVLEMDQEEPKPSITASKSAQILNETEEKMISKRKIRYKNKLKSKKKGKKTSKKASRISGDKSYQQHVGSLTKIVLEHSEGTQTKPLRRTKVYHVATQADQLEIYMSLHGEAGTGRTLKFYTDLVQGSATKSSISIPEVEKSEKAELFTPSSHEAIIVDKKGELTPKMDKYVTVSKMISWFRKLESQSPIPPRVVSYILKRRKSSKRYSIMRRTSEGSISSLEGHSDDKIEDGVDDITSLVEDYKIEDAPIILAQMNMYEAGERNLNKLITTDLTDLVDFNMMEAKGSEAESSVFKPVAEEREDIVGLNKYLLKFKADQIMESLSDDDGFEEEEPFNMETKGKEMNNLLVRLIDNIFETDTKVRKMSNVEPVPVSTVEEAKANVSSSRDYIEDSEEQLQSPSIEEVWKNTTREAWNKRNIEMSKDPGSRAEKEKSKEEVIKEEPKETRQSDLEYEAIGASVGEVILGKTPTDGLSPLAKELYEIRDLIEFYLHSKVGYGLEDPSASKVGEYKSLVAEWSDVAKRIIRSLEGRPQEEAEGVSAQLRGAMEEGRRQKRSPQDLQNVLQGFNEGFKQLMNNVTSSSLYQEKMNPQDLQNLAQRFNDGLSQIMKNFNSSSFQQEMEKIGENLNAKGKELYGQFQEQVKNLQNKTPSQS